jgi:hypothetical protein
MVAWLAQGTFLTPLALGVSLVAGLQEHECLTAHKVLSQFPLIRRMRLGQQNLP